MTSILSFTVFAALLLAVYPNQSEGIMVKECPRLSLGQISLYACKSVTIKCNSDGDCGKNEKCCYRWCESKCKTAVLVKKPCPANVRKVKCSKDPCSVLKCPGYPNARCFSHNCGGCYATFFIGSKRVCAREMPDQY